MRGSWVRLFSCSSRLTVPPLAQFHGAGSFFRSWGIFLLFPRCDSRCIQVVQMFVIQPRQRMRESCCSLGVRITPLFCRCLSLSKETQNFMVVHGAIPRLKYDVPAELRGTDVHLLRISVCPQCGEYHYGSSSSLSFLLFVQVRQDPATLPDAAMPAKAGAGGCTSSGGHKPFGSVEVLTSPTQAAHGRVRLAEDTLCAVATGSVAPAGASSTDS